MATAVPEIAVVDTHALIWWTCDQPRLLGRNARKFFENVQDGRAVACVPTVSLVELSEAIHFGTYFLSGGFDALLQRLEAAPSRYRIVALTTAIVARSHSLFAIPERGDRLIAATAAELGYPVVTRDPAIVNVVGRDHVW